MCGELLGNDIAFSFDCVGRPELPGLKVDLAPASIRACSKTVQDNEDQHDSLLAVSIEDLPLGVHRYSKCVPWGRGPEAFCTNFTLAFSHPIIESIGRAPEGKALRSIFPKDPTRTEDQSQRA